MVIIHNIKILSHCWSAAMELAGSCMPFPMPLRPVATVIITISIKAIGQALRMDGGINNSLCEY